MRGVQRAGTTALTVAALGFVAACGGGDAEGSGGGDAEFTIGLSVSTLNNPFFVDIEQGAQEAAEEFGIELIVQDSQNDPATQISHVETFVTQGVDLILINAVDSDQATAAAAAAANADIPVIALDRSITDGEVVQEIVSDNVQGGELAADALVEAGVEGDVIILQGVPGSSASRERGEGFGNGVEAHSELNVVAEQPANFDRTEGLDVMTNLLESNPDVSAVFAENDEMALGAIQALGERAGEDVLVFGFDGTPDGLDAIVSGTLAGTIAQQPEEMGFQAVEQAHTLLDGGEIEPKIQIEVQAVTPQNVEQYTP
ncbi:substrate-binding domain-containing protein [Actinoalloteichus hymeniacidonis]|uniref:Monosaccharide ABC transporter substrate-binding protein, CUT2 family n=1 Tax=Actinoalloteichus hymeniacidonis TaxID=340345 RepID=A0AAC9HUX3_9PSEU|nr:substrate-binding domain-containing protein [Actinoalloteichus hymeniacidonis]AOS66162.1 monosaccharide ABC transporter substrate-binding protein, CUT2 family [Actinoalloteichus hymeniacidonis]MBB5905735.1 ABC-type sugar transport system substrate-binding protein [Actinoalloteichus hymeniacidonis]